MKTTFLDSHSITRVIQFSCLHDGSYRHDSVQKKPFNANINIHFTFYKMLK